MNTFPQTRRWSYTLCDVNELSSIYVDWLCVYGVYVYSFEAGGGKAKPSVIAIGKDNVDEPSFI